MLNMARPLPDNQERSELLTKLLQLDRPPVAIGFCEVPPTLRRLVDKMEFCRMWARAQAGEAFFATVDNHACLTGQHYLGLRDRSDREAVCRFLVDEVHAYSSYDVVDRYLDSVPTLKPGLARIVCISSLEKAPFTPDIVLVVCSPEQAMLLLWAYSYETGEPVEGETGTAMCVSLVVKPCLSGKPSFSIGDPGGRYIMGLASGEVAVSIPFPLPGSMFRNLRLRIRDWGPQ